MAQKISESIEDLVHRKPYIVAACFHRRYIDANRTPKNAYENEAARQYYDHYHNQIKSCIGEVKGAFPDVQASLLIDIHGQSYQPEVIFRGTRNTETVSALLKNCGEGALIGEESILGVLSGMGIEISPATNDLALVEHPSYDGGFTVYKYGSHHVKGIDAMQLEFGNFFRKPENISKTAQQVALAIVVFYKRWQSGSNSTG